MAKSRTKNSAINASVATLSKIIYIIMSFVCRTFFIKTLGTEYLGVNGLFTNILTILSFAELGIGNAIIFKLYKPIAEEDHERIKTLLDFYKKAYFLIGSFMLVAGICVIPFLSIIIKDAPSIKENIAFIYVLFLCNTSISYFFTYKKSIIIGYQKEYIINLINLIGTFIMNVLQIILLITTHNYVLYLVIQICWTMIENIIDAKIADKKYPYIKEKQFTKISKQEQKNIFDDVKSLVLYKLGYILSNGTDNIIISSFLGVAQVGLLSNYNTITNAITLLLSTAFNSITASVGNLNTVKETEKKESVFYQILLISFFVYGYISIAITLLINKFIVIWIGKQYLLSFAISIALGFNLYIDGMRYVNYTFRNTLGLFKKGRMMPLLSSFANVILSILLVQYIGIFGVLIATGLSRLFILTWYDPYLIHKNEFKTSSVRYYKTYIYYLFITAIAFVVNYYATNMIQLQGILGFIINGIIITILTLLIYILATIKLKEFSETKERVKGIIFRKKIRKEGV